MTVTHFAPKGPTTAAFRCARATYLSGAAVSALIEEAELTPKPGLVDRRGGNSHSDMSVDLMITSAKALRATLRSLGYAAVPYRVPDTHLRAKLGAIGRRAETRMMVATGGVNTHRGAIWALGLLIAAAGMLPTRARPRELTVMAGTLARIPDVRLPKEAWSTNGARACDLYHTGGARAEAAAGFPHVADIALPVLREARARGADERNARLQALLAIMADLDDTCVLHRGGPQGLALVREGASEVLGVGGALTASGRVRLTELDERLRQFRLSPGGSADLLAAALFLDRIDESGATCPYGKE